MERYLFGVPIGFGVAGHVFRQGECLHSSRNCCLDHFLQGVFCVSGAELPGMRMH
jgi:hypothetical protein